MIFLSLFYEFFKVGLFAVGGGTATIPFLINMAERLDWFTKPELLNMIAVSQSTPGPIGINMATYCGYKTAGIPGAFVATFALTLPAFIIIMLIANVLFQYKENKAVQSVFSGIRPAVAGMIAYSAWSVFQVTLITTKKGSISIDKISLIIFAALLVLMNIGKLKKLHPIVWICIGALCGIIFSL